jgi:Fe-S-cluster containining protein
MDPRYLHIVNAVDEEFERNRKLHGHRMRCGQGCTDCCHHRFVISGLEAHHMAEGLKLTTPEIRERLRSRASEYIRRTEQRLPCPALEGGACSIYEHRPLICRKFGMPIYNPEKPERILACELNFKSGEELCDPDLIRIQTGIHEPWREIRDTRRLTVAQAILEAPVWYSEQDARTYISAGDR